MGFIDYLFSILFGIVQGITEWLPISSTGHMIILNEFCKLNVTPEFYDLYLVVIQFGSILAVIFLYFKELWPFGINVTNCISDKKILKNIKKDTMIMWLKILVAIIPAGVVGVLFDDYLDKYFYNYIVVSIMLILFGILFIVVERIFKRKEFKVSSIEDITFGKALIIGIFQLIAAVFPGTSRSGSTIIGSEIIGIRRDIAAKFTFILAVPVMLGASLLKIVKYDGDLIISDIMILLIGMVVAFVVSLFVIKKLMAFIRKHDFSCFGIYRIVLGIIVLVLGLVGVIG